MPPALRAPPARPIRDNNAAYPDMQRARGAGPGALHSAPRALHSRIGR